MASQDDCEFLVDTLKDDSQWDRPTILAALGK